MVSGRERKMETRWSVTVVAGVWGVKGGAVILRVLVSVGLVICFSLVVNLLAQFHIS